MKLLKLVIGIVLISVIIFSTNVSSQSDYVEPSFKFSSELKQGDVIKWKVTEFELNSSAYTTFNDTYVKGIKKGSEIKVEIIKDLHDAEFGFPSTISDYFKISIDDNLSPLAGEYVMPGLLFKFTGSITQGSTTTRFASANTIPLIAPTTIDFNNGTSMSFLDLIAQEINNEGTEIINSSGELKIIDTDNNYVSTMVFEKSTGILSSIESNDMFLKITLKRVTNQTSDLQLVFPIWFLLPLFILPILKRRN